MKSGRYPRTDGWRYNLAEAWNKQVVCRILGHETYEFNRNCQRHD